MSIPGVVASQRSIASDTPWTPAALTTPLALWINDESSVVESAGRIVSVEDISNRRLSVFQNTATARPIAASLNGKRVMEFDNAQSFEVEADGRHVLRNVTAGWFFSVYYLDPVDVANKERPIVGLSVGTSVAFRAGLFASEGNQIARPSTGGRLLDADAYNGARTTVPFAGQWVMALGLIDYLGDKINIYVNGELAGQTLDPWSSGTNTSNTASGGYVIGRNPGSTAFFEGQIAEVMVAQGVPDDSTIDRVFGYAAHHWGLTDLLAADHPYKTEAPTYTPPVLSGFRAVMASAPVVYLAHRGAAYLYPEHTDYAYAQCVATGEPTIEQDLYTNSAGNAVCTHDSTATFATTSTATFASLSDAGVAGLVVDNAVWHGSLTTGVGVPMYSAVLAAYADQVCFITEGKTTAALQRAVVEVGNAGVDPARVLMASFSATDLSTAVAAGHPTMVASSGANMANTAITNGITYTGYERAHSLGFYSNDISRGLEVIMFTPNRRKDAALYRKQGVKAIFTDDPKYLRASGPLATQDTFSTGEWMPGMIAAADDFTRPSLADRGRMIAPNFWGYTETADTRSHCLMGWACPIKGDDAANNFTISFTANIGAVSTGGNTRWGAVYVADASMSDGPYNNEATGNKGYAFVFRKSGVLDVYRYDLAAVTQIATLASPAIATGAEVKFQVVVSPTAVALRRLDGAGVVTHTASANDTTYRGGYFHMGKFGMVVKFKDVIVT